MNRQLKFKVYNTRLKRVVYSLEIGEITNANENNGKHGVTYYECPNADLSCIEAKECVTLQYTGLVDKNSKEIYEGDIVKTDPEHICSILESIREAEKFTYYTNGQVKWWNNGFAVLQPHIGPTRISEYAACGCCNCGLEIIGNIFENPELLK